MQSSLKVSLGIVFTRKFRYHLQLSDPCFIIDFLCDGWIRVSGFQPEEGWTTWCYGTNCPKQISKSP